MGKLLEVKNYQDFLRAEKKISWQYLIYRSQSILSNSLMIRGYSTKKYYKELLNINFAWKNIAHIDFYFFQDISDTKEIQKITADFSFAKINRIINKCYDLGDKIILYSKNIRKKDLGNFLDKELFSLLNEYKKTMLKFLVFVIYPLYAHEKPYEEKIRQYLIGKNIKNVDRVLTTLVYPLKKNINYYEQFFFLSLVDRISRTSQLKKVFTKDFPQIEKELKKYPKFLKEINNHIYKFGWIPCRNFYGQEWSLAEMVERIQIALPTIKSDYQKIKRLELNIKREYKKIITKLNIPKNILKIIEMSKEFAYLRTYRTDVLHKSGFNIRNLLSEIGRRFGYNFIDMIHMRIEEIMNLPNKKISRKDINERKKCFADILINGKMNLFWGKDTIILKKRFLQLIKIQKTTILKGNTANQGNIKGRVKIVRTVEDLSKVKSGDILAAPMTFPSFVPAMEKASAFITDEGGILCHAAIISREMNKPCIIGTKIATQVLKDGDLVEVDADKGVVKILKKAKLWTISKSK